MPTEAKFVDSIAKPLDVSEPVKLQATAEELEAFKAKTPVAPAPPSTPAVAAPKAYPPLNAEVTK